MNANINQFSLSGDDAEFSEIDITKYTTVQDANVTLNAASYNDLSIMNINIVSLPAKMNELQALLSNFDKKPSLITLSETKITEKSNMHYVPFLENYTYLFQHIFCEIALFHFWEDLELLVMNHSQRYFLSYCLIDLYIFYGIFQI